MRQLKRLRVPVAGADRLALIDEIAVMDLVALGDALLLPEDDLTLAAVLKSPLFGLGEEDLFDARLRPRPCQPVRSAAHAGGRARSRSPRRTSALPGCWRRPISCRRSSSTRACSARVAGGKGSSARLGAAALESIEAFLAQALAV